MSTQNWFRPEVSQLPQYVAGKRDTDPNVIKLSSNELPFGPTAEVARAINAAAELVNRYPDMANADLRERLAQFEDWPANGIVLGNGSTALIEKFLQAVAVPGAEVVYPWRSFEAYPIAVLAAGATPVPVPLHADGSHDLEAMLAAITDNTRAIMVCSPNNPTGVPISHAQLEAFLERVPKHIPVLIDEAYIHFASGVGEAIQDSKALARKFPNVLVARTFSKAFGLAGLRVGYVLASAEIAAGLTAISTPFGVNLIAQRAALAALDSSAEVFERVETIVAERERMSRGVRELGFAVPQSAANFIWFAGEGQVSVDDAEAPAIDAARLEELGREEGIITRRFGDEGVRVSVAEPAGTERLLAALEKLGN